MNVNKVELATGQNIFLIDEFFDADILVKIHKLFDTFSKDSPNWLPDPPNDPIHVRYRYDGPDPVIIELETILQSTEFLNKVRELVKRDINFIVLKFWVDTKMLLDPHLEPPNGNRALAQIYITNTTVPFLGTTIYQNDKKLLFQLPYRDNFGWFFEKSDLVMHGKIFETPPGFCRCSIQIMFD